MCKKGDIILINSFKKHNAYISKHSFVILDDKKDKILGVDYDVIALLMGSFKTDTQKAYKMKFPGNFPIVPEDQDVIDGGNDKSGYIVSEQFYYFNMDKIDYTVIGNLDPNIFTLLLEFIEELIGNEIEVIPIIDNL